MLNSIGAEATAARARSLRRVLRFGAPFRTGTWATPQESQTVEEEIDLMQLAPVVLADSALLN